ncbi:SGNH/GDSL hydrolase family protein [Aureliella helgolandensis]|uniref:SGNH hydrolase-type esterase domain-containing protein n=1 Tax=Aureliella helgolandensis TaxID=2527968 RepID=A0A518GCH3_9BACT|nr:SGNH/GDSL hydrolase family protein [Aureliella helgolandensis]QDV26301.1 hypothetical protein Q31a_46730 [Aureliella helgolandensis]
MDRIARETSKTKASPPHVEHPMSTPPPHTPLGPQPGGIARRRRRWLALLAALIGLGIALGLAEIGLRVYVASRGWTANCYATGLVFFVPHPQAGYTLRRNLRLRSTTYDVHTNSLGLRGPEIEVPKPHGTLRIAVLGGSSVFGYLAGRNEDSCRILEAELNAPTPPSIHATPSTDANTTTGAHPAKRFEVLNAGVPGYNMHQCLQRFETEIAPLAPDWVLLYLGWNDSEFAIRETESLQAKTPAAPPWSQRALSHSVLYGLLRFRLFPAARPKFAPPAGAETRITAQGEAGFQRDLRALIQSVREQGATPILSTQLMAARAECDNGATHFLGNSPEQIAANQRIAQWITQTIRDAASETQTPLIDVSQLLTCNPDYLGDAIHLTAEGHRAVAQAWLDGLKPLLSNVNGPANNDSLQTSEL